MTTCKLIAGFDGGNGLCKAAFSDGQRTVQVSMPSYLYGDSNGDEAVYGPDGAVVQYLSGSRQDLAGKRFLLGTTAYINQPRSTASVADHRMGKVDYGLQLFLGCLAHMNITGPVDIKLAVSVHDKQALRNKIIEAYNGTHDVVLNGQRAQVTIKSGCAEEGNGAIYFLQSQGLVKTATILVADFGYVTTRAAAYQNGEKGFAIVPSSEKILEVGVKTLLTQMARHESLVSLLKGRADVEIIRSSMERVPKEAPSRRFYGNSLIDLIPAYRATMPGWIGTCLVKAYEALQDWELQAPLYAIGGGTNLPGVKEILTQVNPLTGRPKFIVPDNSQHINSEGLLLAARKL